MHTYRPSNFKQIAEALGVQVGQIAPHENIFEAAALWYRLDRKRPKRTATSNVRRKVSKVAKDARRLLKTLDVNNSSDALDGPGDREIFYALVLSGEHSEDRVLEATRRVGRLAELIEGVAAVAEFERRAKKAAVEIADIAKLTVREGNRGDDAINDWTASMMSLYRTITGKKPATSVGAPERKNDGIAAGPLIRFLQAAGKPLNIKFSEDAWRSRVRTILKGASRQN